MENSDYSSNPFAALFPSISDAEQFKSSSSKEPVACKSNEPDPEQLKIHNFLEEILQITVAKDETNNFKAGFVFLEDLYDGLKGWKLLSFETLDQAIFERVMMDEPVCKTNETTNDEADEKRILFYLYHCFVRNSKSNLTEYKNIASEAILQQTSIFLSHSEWFPNQTSDQLIELLHTYHTEKGHSELLSEFLVRTANIIDKKFKSQQDDSNILSSLSASLEDFRQRLLKMSLVDRNLFIHLELLQYFFKTPEMSLAVIEFSMPADEENGRAYQESLLGAFLCPSCLPRKASEPLQFFQNPSQFTQQEHSITEQNLWMPLKSLSLEMSKYFYTILKQSSSAKMKLLEWISKCLNANSGRSKLWNNQFQDVASESLYASDGFILNMESVLLNLCKPFAQPLSPKLLKVQSSYTRAVPEGGPIVHLKSLAKETTLITKPDAEPISHPVHYNFVTELFFCTHYALHIGFKVVQEQLTKLSQDLGRVQRLYEDTLAQGASLDIVDQVKQNMERGMAKFLSLKTALLEPDSLEMMLNFHLATATYLVKVALFEGDDGFSMPKFPLPTKVPDELAFVPELIVENVKDCVIFIRHFSAKTFEQSGMYLEHLMSLILVFMGSPERMKNPHLRANLAEMLEALMPPKDASDGTNSIFSNNKANRERLFLHHPLGSQLVPTLLHVFVSIEMTGQSVAFEQKFQYRRPMYTVLEYLWSIERHKKIMKDLAEEAENNIDASTAPLFLRFINLLMNDAIFLLDEALSYMSQLKDLQQQRDRGEWAELPASQRHQNEANFQHMGLLARFHNVMGTETICTLRWLTSQIKSIFCHPTMVDRVAAMLNYFLLHLVGPKKKNFRVKDLGVYEFKPQELVADICQIYLNLGGNEEQNNKSVAFCSAVSRDGRSYSYDLFVQAQIVLNKIGQGSVANEIEVVAKTIGEFAERQEKDDAVLGEIPEEFLDPIMSTLMVDPVILPSSGISIDRATISRHLLSDQTDPFNRTPLSMEMVQPDDKLKTKIESWLKQQRS